MQSLAFLYMGVIVPASVIIPIVFAIVKYRHINKPLTTIFLYLLFAGLVNACASVLAFRHINNLPLLHVYTIIEFLFLGIFFYQFIEQQKVRKLILGSILLFPVFGVVNFSFIQNLHAFNSYARSVEAVLLIVFSVIFFYTQTSDKPDHRWHMQPETWIVTGILIYFSSALVQFSFSNIVSNLVSRNTKLFIWAIHATLVLIMYLLFAVGFAKNARYNR
jgi:hypothetical protein